MLLMTGQTLCKKNKGSSTRHTAGYSACVGKFVEGHIKTTVKKQLNRCTKYRGAPHLEGNRSLQQAP